MEICRVNQYLQNYICLKSHIYAQLVGGRVQTKYFVCALNIFFHRGFYLWNHMSYPKKSPPATHLQRFFQKTVWVTKGGTRKGQFREVVAKAKRCIFLHIENEKLILGPYKEVYFSAFFKNLFGQFLEKSTKIDFFIEHQN